MLERGDITTMIIIDVAEKDYVLKVFDEVGIPYKVEEIAYTLEGEKKRVGDFTNDKNTFIVERKRIDDLWKSMIDYRLYEQLNKLDEYFDCQKYLIIENYSWFTDSFFEDDDNELFEIQKMSPLQKLAYLHPNKENWIMSVVEECVSRDISPIQTWNTIETAKFIYQIDKGAGNQPKLRSTKKNINQLSLDENILVTISGIGKERASALISEFGSLGGLITEIRSWSEKDYKKSKIKTKLKEVFG